MRIFLSNLILEILIFIMDIDRLKSIQEKMAGQVITKDRIGKISYVAGFDVAYNKKYTCVGVVCKYRTMAIKEISVSKGKTIPYIPGYLAFREGPLILKAYKKLKKKPDVILVDGNGILHPRKFGLACWVGIKTKKPTIGVAKSLLCGDIHKNFVYINGEKRGYLLKNKRLYISPGHLISLKTAVKIVKNCIKNRLPEPIKIAHAYAKDISCKD